MKRMMVFLIIAALVTQAAVFNRVNTVINSPAAWQGVIGTFELGGSWAPYTSSGQSYWEDDYYLNYAVTDFLLLGVTRINGNDIAGNLQMLLAKDLLFPKLNLAFGIDNIMAKDKSSTFDNLSEKYPNNMSMYMVATYRMDQWELSTGFGEGRLANFYNPYTPILSNLFYSVSYFFSKDGKNVGRISYEFDSRDSNIGAVIPLNNQIDLKLALTALPFRSGNNANYGDIPMENFSVGVDYKINLFSFYGDEYNQFAGKLKDMDDKSNIIGEKYQAAVAAASKSERILAELTVERNKMREDQAKVIQELKNERDHMKLEVKALRDVVESEGFKNVQILKEDIMKHYYRALEYYYDEKYFDAIEELTKAKMINNKIPEIHVRLGSIYWTLGLKQEAIDAWKAAYDLDKNNEVLNTFLKSNHISFDSQPVNINKQEAFQ